MSPDQFIARKLKFQGKLAAASIAVSFLVIIVAVAVSSGFRHSVRDGVARLTGDIRIAPSSAVTSEGAPIPVHLASEEAILGISGIFGTFSSSSKRFTDDERPSWFSLNRKHTSWLETCNSAT